MKKCLQNCLSNGAPFYQTLENDSTLMTSSDGFKYDLNQFETYLLRGRYILIRK